MRFWSVVHWFTGLLLCGSDCYTGNHFKHCFTFIPLSPKKSHSSHLEKELRTLSGLSYVSSLQSQLDILISDWPSEVFNTAVGTSRVSAWYKLCNAETGKASPGWFSLRKLSSQGRAILYSGRMAVFLSNCFICN